MAKKIIELRNITKQFDDEVAVIILIYTSMRMNLLHY